MPCRPSDDLLLKRHGVDAELAAAQRADEMLNRGDVEGYAVWRRILSAVADLTRTKRAVDERVN
jgi:hypothetical protein